LGGLRTTIKEVLSLPSYEKIGSLQFLKLLCGFRGLSFGLSCIFQGVGEDYPVNYSFFFLPPPTMIVKASSFSQIFKAPPKASRDTFLFPPPQVEWKLPYSV